MTTTDFTAQRLDGAPQSLDQWAGQVLLIVNTASRCGYTPQYRGLEEAYRRYRDRGFAVLGFPCNQFGRQEPDGEAAIGAFCAANYGVSFPMFAKINVNGPDAHPLWAHLKRQKSGVLGGRIVWNFTKFLVDRAGVVRARFAPMTTPAAIAPRIEALL